MMVDGTNLTWRERLLLAIFRRFPATDTIFKDPGPRAQAEYASELELPFQRWFGLGPELFAGRDVLDLGSGFGGRTIRFAELGARVTGVEIDDEVVARALSFASSRAVNARFLKGSGEHIPCADESFDLVTMFDVLEHVVSPEAVLAEIRRVLRPGGSAAIVFPPYYDVTAGSHLHGYATSFPALNLFFSTRALRRAARALFAEQNLDWRRCLREVPTDKLWNQNGLTVLTFRSLLRDCGLRVARFDTLGHMEPRLSAHRGFALAWRLPFYLPAMIAARTPIVQEALCSRVAVILEKPRAP
jgi:SAM-dependent methyltransferase